MTSLEEATERLYTAVIKNKIEFPKRWKEKLIKRACGATLMLHSNAEGFDEDGAFKYMTTKYGTSEQKASSPRKRKSNDSLEQAEKKRAVQRKHHTTTEEIIHGGGNKDTNPDFAPMAYEIVAVEDNRPIVEAIKELGALHFKLNEPKIGISCMKAVKYLRKHPHAITDKQSAIQVYGVGEKLADHIDEFLKTGDVQHWEDLRARLLRAEMTPKA